jgi:dinuclear metal center YbgI/SA1388 family protein
MGCALDRIVAALERIAPPGLADDWDNVGLLIDGPAPDTSVERCLLTIDLTDLVLDEAIDGGYGLVVAYHPPIFAKLSRLRWHIANERVVLRAARAGIAVYSPHTALDAAPGGVNDWLADGLGEGLRQSLQPILGAPRRRLEARLAPEEADALVAFLGIGLAIDREMLRDGSQFVRCTLDPDGERALRALSSLPEELRSRCELVSATTPPGTSAGQGRQVDLSEHVTLDELVARIKAHLKLAAVRVAVAEPHRDGAPVVRVLVCAGAGGSVLAPLPADVYWTGEMRHHDVLAALARGTSVVLCDHTNTERGYLPTLRERLLEETAGAVAADVSRADREPLEFT